MTSPLPLPPWVKVIGRSLRDNSTINAAVTSVVRPFLNKLPEVTRKAWMAHIPRVGLAVARLPDGRPLKMYCNEPESLLNSLFYRGWTGEEPETLPLWAALAARAGTIIDVGAHIGHFSIVAGLANPSAEIIAFEPLPRVAELLRRNLVLNRLENVSVEPRALGRSAGARPIFAFAEGIPSSSSLSEEFMRSAEGMIEATTVDVTTLDATELPTRLPVIMKIDTETTEAEVIAGGAGFIGRTQPVMIIEILNATVGGLVERELNRAGYEFDAYLLTDEGPIAHQSLVGDATWRNFALIPRDQAAINPFRAVLESRGINCNL